MSAPLILSATTTNASTAGLTSAEPAVPTAAPASFTEALSVIPTTYGGLEHLFSEGIPSPIATPQLERPTGSVAGKLGGLVPTGVLSAVKPGPGLQQAPEHVTKAATDLVTRARKFLGV